MNIIYLLAIFGIVQFIKESDVMSWPRTMLLRVHPIFFKLLTCYYCLGFWVGLLVYLAQFSSYRVVDHIIWGFGGAAISITLSSFAFTLAQGGLRSSNKL